MADALEKVKRSSGKALTIFIRRAKIGIGTYGHLSICHLCLPNEISYPLLKNYVVTIPDLRKYLALSEEERRKKRIRNIGPHRIAVITAYLAEFDTLIEDWHNSDSTE
jgi:hypothetical protein